MVQEQCQYTSMELNDANIPNSLKSLHMTNVLNNKLQVEWTSKPKPNLYFYLIGYKSSKPKSKIQFLWCSKNINNTCVYGKMSICPYFNPKQLGKVNTDIKSYVLLTFKYNSSHYLSLKPKHISCNHCYLFDNHQRKLC